jgi:c-di-AMP phosphodiesterase-like protein
LFKKFAGLFKKDEQNENDDGYLFVSENEINEKLKRNIVELENIGEKWGKFLQRKYAEKFNDQGKHDLRIWVCRDIDGDEEDNLTSDRCLEKEYRSQIVIDFDGPKIEDDFYEYYIPLWYYFGGYSKGSGTLYDLSKNKLEADIEEALKILLKN